MPADRREGPHLINEETPAQDVRIEDDHLRDGWTVRFDEISGPLVRPLDVACIDAIVQFGGFQIVKVFTLLEEAGGRKDPAVFADISNATDDDLAA